MLKTELVRFRTQLFSRYRVREGNFDELEAKASRFLVPKQGLSVRMTESKFYLAMRSTFVNIFERFAATRIFGFGGGGGAAAKPTVI